MKKLALLFLSIYLFASSQTPPPPPVNVHKKAKKLTLPKECKTIPPMIIFLPPPMEKELIACKNAVFKPRLGYIQKKIKDAIKVEPFKGFERVYKITLKNKKTLLCNKTITICIEPKNILTFK